MENDISYLLPPLYFNRGFAKHVGLYEAIVFAYINHQICNIESQKIKENFYENKYWFNQSVSEMIQRLPFFSEKQLYTTLKRLTKLNYLIEGNLNNHRFDRTKWYAIGEGEKNV